MTVQDEYQRRLLQDVFGGAGETRLREVRANSLLVGTNDNTHQFSEDGTQLFRGRARFRREIFTNVGDLKEASLTPPVRAFRQVGASGTLYVDVWQFSAADKQDVYLEYHVPLDADLSMPFYLHMMWTPGTGYTTGNFLTAVEYLVAPEYGQVLAGTPKTITKTIASPTAGYWREDEYGPIYVTQPESKIMTHFYRDAANVLDTANGTLDLDFLELSYVANRFGDKEDL